MKEKDIRFYLNEIFLEFCYSLKIDKLCEWLEFKITNNKFLHKLLTKNK